MTAKAPRNAGVRAKVKKLRDESGLSFGEIGKILEVSRQRAHQLYMESKDGARSKKNK